MNDPSPGAAGAGLTGRYARIDAQLEESFAKQSDPVARRATAVALPHQKMPHFFWIGAGDQVRPVRTR